MNFATADFPVGLAPAPARDPETAGMMKAAITNEYELFLNAGGPPIEIRRLANLMNRLKWVGTERDRRVNPEDPEETAVPMPLSVMSINGLVLIFMHSEIPMEVTELLRQRYPRRDLWTVSLTGGGLGYFSTPAMIDEGGYEGRSCVITRTGEPQMRRDIAVLMKKAGLVK